MGDEKMDKKEGAFIREHPIAVATAYLLLLEFANMYGFWRPFRVNIFGFTGLLDSLTNGLQFVADGFVNLMVRALFLWLLVFIVLWLHGRSAKKRGVPAFSIHEWLGTLQPGSKGTIEWICVFLVIGALGAICSLLTSTPYGIWFCLVSISGAAGFAGAAMAARRKEPGWSRTLRMVSVFLVALLPASVFVKGAHAAHAIKRGCGDVRLSASSLKELDITGMSDLPVYLGHAEDHFFFYDDVVDEVLIVKQGEKQIALVHSPRQSAATSAFERTWNVLAKFSLFFVPACAPPPEP